MFVRRRCTSHFPLLPPFGPLWREKAVNPRSSLTRKRKENFGNVTPGGGRTGTARGHFKLFVSILYNTSFGFPRNGLYNFVFLVNTVDASASSNYSFFSLVNITIQVSQQSCRAMKSISNGRSCETQNFQRFLHLWYHSIPVVPGPETKGKQ